MILILSSVNTFNFWKSTEAWAKLKILNWMGWQLLLYETWGTIGRLSIHGLSLLWFLFIFPKIDYKFQFQDKLNDEKDTKQLRIINIDKSLDGYQIVWQFDDSPSLQILSILVHKYEMSKISRHFGLSWGKYLLPCLYD